MEIESPTYEPVAIVDVLTHVMYTPTGSRGPLALVVTSVISLCAVIAILVAMAISGFKTRHEFIRSQVGAYFLSLVFSDLLQATGSVMNAKWVVLHGVGAGSFCTAQAVLKQSGNVGTALWSLVIAVHTFCLLFLRYRMSNALFYTILVGVWLFITFIILLGPLIIQRPERGPFWGISGYWCWITDEYHVEQFTGEYLYMFLAAATSFILYALIFFRLRGNLQGSGRSLRFHQVDQPWIQDEDDESQLSTMGKQMLWYPVAYTILITPISICRWSSIFGHHVPYWATMACDSIFMLSGLVNAVLYSTTRNILSRRSFRPILKLFHSRSLHRDHAPEFSASKPHFDDMQFASPVSPLASDKFGTSQMSMSSVTPGPLWGSRSDTCVCAHEDPSWRKSSMNDSIVPESRVRNVPEEHVIGESRPSIVASQSVESPSHTHHHQSSSSRTRPLEPTIAETGSSVIAQDSPETTDSAPSLHRKRFSGWSLPSFRDANSEGQESAQAELEEMRFAPPSPEPMQRKPLPLRSSFSDLHSTRWLP